MEESPPQSSIPPWVKKFVPIIVSILILYYYFHDQDWNKLAEAAGKANLIIAVLAILIPQLIFWFCEVLITDRHMTWFHGPFDWRSFTWVRGAIYFLILVNPALGGGGVYIYLQRKTKMTWSKLMGIALFRFGLTIWGITILLIPATLLMHYYGMAEKAKINMWVWWAFLIFGVVWCIEAWIVWHYNKDFGLSKIVVRDRNSEFWTAFRTATKRQWYLTWAIGVPPFLFMLIGFYFLTRAFDINVPFLHFIVVAPLAMAIMDAPIAFAGFGTTTLAWVLFFGEYGSTGNIAACSLFLPFARASIRALIGVVSLKPAIGDISDLSSVRASDEEPTTSSAENEKT